MAKRSRHCPWAGALAVIWVLFTVGCTVYPSSVPAEPAFDTDVRPIFLAHCTRCHGAGPDGGNLNPAAVPGVVYTDAGPPLPSDPFLTQYGDVCSKPTDRADGGAPICSLGRCRCGALTYASNGQIQKQIHSGLMPPRPAPPLDDWEMKVIDAWAAQKKPVCSNSPNPDPALFCDGGM
jgi:hypothetical protein